MEKKDPGHYANPESDFLCVRSLSCIVFSALVGWGVPTFLLLPV